MPASAFAIHPEALLEAEADLAFYAARSPAAGVRLLADFERAVARILETPRKWPAHILGTRRYVLQRFPYSGIYRESPAGMTIYALAHARRRPGYWRSRLT
jgi:toxin ParE1/3/4